MAKLLYFSIIHFSLLLPGIVFSHPLLANTNYPVEPNSEVDVPFCYLDTTEGRMDLRNLCGSQPEEASTCTSNADAAGMPISNVRYDGNSVRGQVTNRTCKTVTLVKVNYQVLDDQGNEIDNGFFEVEPSTITQGKTASFGGAIAPGSEVKITHLEWSDV